MKNVISLLLMCALVLGAAATADAATYYIPDDYSTFQAAVDGVAAGDTIIVRDGTYTGPGNRDIVFPEKALTLQSENGPANCIIDCQNAGRGLYFHVIDESHEIVVDGFTITNGSISGNPGGWLSNAGGGIFCQSASPTIKNCIITGNYAASHGGGINTYMAWPVILDCVISGNTTLGGGGGINASFSPITIIGCEITGNIAPSGGGGIFLGVAAFAPGYDFTITNSLIAGNTSANSSGAGIAIVGSTAGPFPAAVSNCTITGNTAGVSGGGLLVNTGAAPVVTDCIIWGNTAPASADVVVPDNYHPAWLDIDFSDIAGGQAAIDVSTGSTLTYGADNIDADPLFVTGPLGDHYLSQISAGQASQTPCYDAGSASAISLGLDNTWTRTDAFPDNSTVDMGYHYGPNFGPAETIYVPDDYATIQAAVDAAPSGSTIIVRDGTYTGAGNKDVVFGGRSLTLESENGAATCTIDCENDGRGFNIDMNWNNNGDVTLDGFTIINGDRSGHVQWVDNSGAGILIRDGSPTINDCYVLSNTSASHGGGIMNYGANSLITNCVVAGNTSGSYGGGIRSVYSEPTIMGCWIDGNNAAYGGGISIHVSPAGPAGGPHVTNCLITGNTAGSAGGLQCQTGSTGPLPVTITSSTIAGNSATTSAGGFQTSGGAFPVATDCIFWGNTAPASPGIYVNGSGINGGMEIAYSDVAGGQAGVTVEPGTTLTWGAGNIDSDPLFATGTLGDYYLGQTASGQGATSPCVDTGSDTAVNVGLDATWTRTDGVVDGGLVDIGFHYGVANTPPPPCTYSILPTSASPGASGGSDSVAVTAGVGCAWTATSNDAWITIDSGTPGSGNGSVGYTVAVNPGPSSRVGTMTIAGETFTVNQAAPTPCAYSILPTSASVVGNGVTDSVAVTADGGCAWTAVSNDAWITIDSGSPGSGNGTVGYTVAANPAITPRVGAMTIAGETFTVNQARTSALPYYVPDDYSSIGAALLDVPAGSTVIVRDGAYSGPDNRNLSFGGKDITLRSENGPDNCIIDGQNAGGVFVISQGETSAAVIDGFTIVNGSAGYGGGIYCVNSSPTIRNCFIDLCSSSYGSGIALYNSTSSIINCMIVRNTSSIGAGGIFLYGSDPTITHCTITENTAISGGGIFCLASNPIVTNSIVTNNTATYGPQLLLSTASSLAISYSDVQDGQATAYVEVDCTLIWNAGNITDDPLFNPGVANYHLTGASPCIDAGTDAGVATDIDGDARPLGSAPDMGADEQLTTTTYVPDDYATIQAALNGAADGDLVIVRDGTYTGAGNTNLDFFGKAIRLRSENGPATCIIDCEGAGRGFSLWQGETAATIIDGFTIINGSTGYGGGIYAANSSPTIRNCIIKNCTAEYGAGVTLSTSDATLTNCDIVQNTSNIGAGGIYLYNSDTAIKHCTIADNTAISGGGIFCYSASPTITNTILWDNTATWGTEILIDVSSTLTIDYSDVEWGQLYAYVGADSSLVWGATNGSLNPLFVGGGNYHLTAPSPCVNKGTAAGVTTDIDGDSRPSGAGYEMGSDEVY